MNQDNGQLHPPKREEPVVFPPPPWQLEGTAWAGLFRAVDPVPLPPWLDPVMPRLLAVAVIRYQGGTLDYNEFVLAGMARHGRHLGAHIHELWVDSPAAQQGGRHIWGLPKRLAAFTWDHNHVHITDDRGLHLTIAITPRTKATAPMPVRGTAFATLEKKLLRTTVTARSRIRPATLHLTHWPDALPLLHRPDTSRSANVSFHGTIPAPRTLGMLADSTTA